MSYPRWLLIELAEAEDAAPPESTAAESPKSKPKPKEPQCHSCTSSSDSTQDS